MSKVQLKKELQGMSREQLIDIILNVYAARKDAKEYFEFFLNPDCDALLTKYCEAVNKEIGRTKRGRMSKLRISVVKRMIKDFESFDPGPEYVLRFIAHCFGMVMLYSMVSYYSQTQDNAALWLAREVLAYGDRNQLYDKATKYIDAILSDERRSAAYLRTYVSNALANGD